MSDAPPPPPSEDTPLLTVAIVGRPNVGKSTLFNRLVGNKLALVDDRPGVTRDRREGVGRVGPLQFKVIDTAGLDDQPAGSLEARMRQQSERAVVEADVALFLIDARAGITALDREIAQDLRRSPTPVVLVANKAERQGLPGMVEAYELGLGEPVPISAEHGEGLADLYDLLAPFAPESLTSDVDDEEPATPAEETVKPLRLAIVGRPNVGKSTLINRLLGEDRMLTGPEAGITRDAIAIDWVWEGRPVRLIDTAGMRRRARVEEKLESLSVADTLRAIRFAEGVVLVLDATQMLEKQDLAIARLVEDEGRALIIAINKWDLIEDRAAALQQLKDRLQTSLPQMAGLVFVTVSAMTNRGLDGMMKAVFANHEVWNKRISTPRLNRWLVGVQERHPPPLVAGRRLKLRYMTQANTRPPTFALFSSKPGDLPDAYRRYLINTLRDDFDLPGVPVRMMLRKSENPYADKE